MLGNQQLRTDSKVLGVCDVVCAHDTTRQFAYLCAPWMVSIFLQLFVRDAIDRLALLYVMNARNVVPR
jgi:hypothetical protein